MPVRSTWLKTTHVKSHAHLRSRQAKQRRVKCALLIPFQLRNNFAKKLLNCLQLIKGWSVIQVLFTFAWYLLSECHSREWTYFSLALGFLSLLEGFLLEQTWLGEAEGDLVGRQLVVAMSDGGDLALHGLLIKWIEENFLMFLSVNVHSDSSSGDGWWETLITQTDNLLIVVYQNQILFLNHIEKRVLNEKWKTNQEALCFPSRLKRWM